MGWGVEFQGLGVLEIDYSKARGVISKARGIIPRLRGNFPETGGRLQRVEGNLAKSFAMASSASTTVIGVKVHVDEIIRVALADWAAWRIDLLWVFTHKALNNLNYKSSSSLILPSKA